MQHDIVILGGGAGGVELAARLGRALGRREGPERVLLVDRSPYHLWKPTLHEVAAGTLDAHQEGLSWAVLARRNHFRYRPGEVVAFDPPARRLMLGPIRDDAGATIVPERSVGFGTAVLAIGCGSNFFGTPGAAEHAWVLERSEDAERFRRHLLAAFTRAAFTEQRDLAIVIVGAGATGVELAAELLEAHALLQQGMHADQRFRLAVTLVEAGPRILAGLPEKISRQAQATLEQRGVRVKTATAVTAVHADRVATATGGIAADIVVWAAGIQAAAANRGFGLETNRANQFVVDDRLCTSAPDVYALGDCAACPWIEGRQVPARAQAAHQQATYLARMLLARQRGRAFDAPYAYRDFGSLVSLGERRGVGNLMGGLLGRSFFVEGLVAKAMYMGLHLNHHRAILGLPATIVLALARLLQRRVSGRLKLH